MIMVHGDNKGLVLPPKVAPIQMVIVPIFVKDKSNDELSTRAKEIVIQLEASGYRAHFDSRTQYNPGWKYNHWELKGVPLRLEFGHKDLSANKIVVVRRDNGAKEDVSLENIVKRVAEIIVQMHQNMLEKAKKSRDESISQITTWNEFIPALDKKNIVLAPWCGTTECEDDIKAKSGERKEEPKKDEKKDEEFEPLTGAAKSLCIPFEQPKQAPGKCFCCGHEAVTWVLWGRSY